MNKKAPLTPYSNVYLRPKKRKEFEFPYHIQTMHLGDVETTVTLAVPTEPLEPVATLHFIKGFKSHPHYYKKFLDELTESGINVVLVTLPDPENDIDFLEDYEKIVRAVAIDGELDHLTPPDQPKFIGGHSTAAYLQTAILQNDDDNALAYTKRYAAPPVLAASFYGNAIQRHPVTNRLAKIFEKVIGPESSVGDSWVERAFTGADELDDSGAPEHHDLKMIANRRQAFYMDSPTKNFIEKVRKEGFCKNVQTLGALFLLGEDDKVGSNKLSQEVANAMHADCVTIKGGHSFIRKSKTGRDLLKNYILQTLEKGPEAALRYAQSKAIHKEHRHPRNAQD